jgi:hypothetical protein
VKVLSVAVTVLALALPAGAYEWRFELADTSGKWTRLQLGIAPDGVVHLCYSDSSSTVHHAYRDSLWHHETVGTYPPLWYYNWDMDVGTHGELGILLNFADGNAALLEKRDSTWTIDSLSITTPDPRARFSWDSAGVPAAFYTLPGWTSVGYLVRADSQWVCETLPMEDYPEVRGFVHSVRNEPCAVILLSSADGMMLHLYVKRDTWCVYTLAWVNRRGSISMLASAPDADSAAAVCFNWTQEVQQGFNYKALGGGRKLQDGLASVAGLALDSTGVPHVIFVDNGTSGPLKHAYFDGNTWTFDTVRNGNIALLGGIALLDGRPVVAFYEPGMGVIIAEIVLPGVAEQPRPMAVGGRCATLLAGRSLTVAEPCLMLDLSGRRVMNLATGPNDVSGLAPGVYFVREARAQAQAQPIRKVIVTR